MIGAYTIRTGPIFGEFTVRIGYEAELISEPIWTQVKEQRKIPACVVNRSPTVQLVVSHLTDRVLIKRLNSDCFGLFIYY